ncbi:MAG: tyrosine-type recombinase/integrase [Ruminococcaceae bacterium]|nr:tyrosine-type recombinase/integrase [Oscillospiraceae bacterium]
MGKISKTYVESDYIFTWEDGTVIIPGYASHKMKKIVAQNNLKKVTLHQLRHSCASILISEFGFTLMDVKDWLGHSDIKMTGNLYGHLEYGRKINMAKTFDKKLGA